MGMMGSGKTALGARVAARLGVPFVDTDAEVAARFSAPITDIFARHGEEEFRRVEHEVIVEVSRTDGVIATGGGAVLLEENIEIMRSSGTVVWLAAEPETLASRVEGGWRRPLLAGATSMRERLAEILDGRRSLYERAAHVRIDTDGRSTADVVRKVAELWITS